MQPAPPRYVHQAGRAGRRRHLFAGLPDRCRGGRIAHVHGAAEDAPAIVMAGMADEHDPACPVDGQDRPEGNSSSSCPITAPSLAMCAAIPTWVTLRSGGGNPRRERAAASSALIVPAPASSQRVQVRPPGEQTAGAPARRRAKPRAVAVNCKPVAEVAANETLGQLAQAAPWPISRRWTAVRGTRYLCATRNTHYAIRPLPTIVVGIFYRSVGHQIPAEYL